jgi:hypothetical protein
MTEMIQSMAFLFVAVILCVAMVLSILWITDIYMAGSEAIEHDGLHRGAPAPAWSLPGSSGVLFHSPPAKPFQLIAFTDHSITSFPSLVDGLRELSISESTPLEIVILLRRPNSIAEPVLRMLGLDGIPVLTGSAELYSRYNVRVIPWAIIVDSDGRVRASSLVNESWQITMLWRIARVPLAPSAAAVSAASRFRRRMSRAGA